MLPAQDPYLGLLPKQFVLGGWCLPSVAAAMLLGSRPGTWDPERAEKKWVKKMTEAPTSSSLLPSLPPSRKETQKHNSSTYCRTDPPAHKDPLPLCWGALLSHCCATA